MPKITVVDDFPPPSTGARWGYRGALRAALAKLAVGQTAVIEPEDGESLEKISTHARAACTNEKKASGRVYTLRTLAGRDPPCIAIWRLS